MIRGNDRLAGSVPDFFKVNAKKTEPFTNARADMPEVSRTSSRIRIRRSFLNHVPLQFDQFDLKVVEGLLVALGLRRGLLFSLLP